jgi:hypothetical protein
MAAVLMELFPFEAQVTAYFSASHHLWSRQSAVPDDVVAVEALLGASARAEYPMHPATCYESAFRIAQDPGHTPSISH